MKAWKKSLPSFSGLGIFQMLPSGGFLGLSHWEEAHGRRWLEVQGLLADLGAPRDLPEEQEGVFIWEGLFALLLPKTLTWDEEEETAGCNEFVCPSQVHF